MRLDHKEAVAFLTNRKHDEADATKELIASYKKAVSDARIERDELIAKVSAGFVESPSPFLLRMIESSVLSELREKEGSAYWARDRAMAAVWQVTKFHTMTFTDKCKCGKPLSACSEYQALEFIWDTYDNWVRHQTQRMEDGLEHGLPSNYPAAQRYFTDSRRWKGRRSTEPEERHSQSA